MSTDETNEYVSYKEWLKKESRFWGTVWSGAEILRLVGAGVLFVGPVYVLVTWFFDFLKQAVDPNQYPDLLKEWFFYVLLISALLAISLPALYFAAIVQSYIWRQFPRDQE